MKFRERIYLWRIGFSLLILVVSVLWGCAQKVQGPPPGRAIPPTSGQPSLEAGQTFFEESPSLSMEDMAQSAASLSEKSQSVSQEAEKLRAEAQKPIQLPSLPPAKPLPPPATPSLAQLAEKSGSLSTQAQSVSQEAEKLRAEAQKPIQLPSLPPAKPLPPPATPSLAQLAEKSGSLSTQAQSVSQEAEKLRTQLTAPPPGSVVKSGPLGPEEQGLKVVEVPSALVPEKEVELFPSLQALGKKKEKEKSPLFDVFFAYDQALLTEEAQRILQMNGEWLRSNPEAQILVEGHCDERGTVEYNLALGERRAQSAKDYLMNLGISKDRLSSISYGKERPFASGHTEEAWAQNRRAHFVLRSP